MAKVNKSGKKRSTPRHRGVPNAVSPEFVERTHEMLQEWRKAKGLPPWDFVTPNPRNPDARVRARKTPSPFEP